MTLAFVTNLVHHHQLPVADEFYKQLGDSFHYIATMPLTDVLIRGGYDPNLDRNYIIRPYRSQQEMEEARRLVDECDVVIYGAAPLEWVMKRQENNKVTFHYSERWLKDRIWRNFTPWNLKRIWYNYGRFRKNKVYMLCASAFTAQDVHRFGCFPHKCFKWGYFTRVDADYKVLASDDTLSTGIVKIMWCARFIDWKHPELPILLANRLKSKGYRFQIDMYGGGEMFGQCKDLIVKLGVEDYVKLLGNLPNDIILKTMREYEIFLFTSDRNEGWGAVLNEAMSNGCATIASHDIGSAPFLIKNKENGLLFKSKDLDSLEEQVVYLLENPNQRKAIRREAVYTMQNKWSPTIAANAFLGLAECALADGLAKYNVNEGPASWA